MTWTSPKTWATGDLLTAADMNTYLRDNTAALKAPPTKSYLLNESANYTTTSTSFVDVDATADKLSFTLDSKGGDIMIHFYAYIVGTGLVYFDVTLDGNRVGGDDGLILGYQGYGPITFTFLKTGVSSGSHTYKLQWKVNTGTGALYAGAGTSLYDLHPQFWVREVS
jgi:hypothetical protein